MNNDLTENYREIKAAILHRYDITEEIYHQKFLSTWKVVEESYVDLVI